MNSISTHPIVGKLPQNQNGQIGDDVYASYQCSESELIRIFIGTRYAGPVLQYDANGHGRYNGGNTVDFDGGCWTPVYSRGNYGKRYAFGGNFSGHYRGIHPRIQAKLETSDKTWNKEVIVAGNHLIEAPADWKADITITSIDCSVGWSIWYPSARDAFSDRLTPDEIQAAMLPAKTKQHYRDHVTKQTLLAVIDVIEAYKL